MRTPPEILIVDDNPVNVDILQTRLQANGYQTLTASDGEQALAVARSRQPDLILLDVMMPGIDGFEVCRRLKADASMPFIPVIIVTAKGDPQDVVAGLDAGGDEYLTKPVDHRALVARVKSMLRIKALHDTINAQQTLLAGQAQELRDRNERLRMFFPPQVAELVIAPGNEALLESHRREITVVACDLGGFATLGEMAAPEDAIHVLRQFHAAMGEIVSEFSGTLERFDGEGLVVFFNDPLPCADPASRAIRMAVAMRDRVQQLAGGWRKRGYDLTFRAGVALGYATLGKVGFEGRFHYGAIGSVVNQASALLDHAEPWQILLTHRVAAETEDIAHAEAGGTISCKGLAKPLAVYDFVGLLHADGSVPRAKIEAAPEQSFDRAVARPAAGPAEPGGSAAIDASDPMRWQRLRAMFGEALDRSPEDRAAFVDQACRSDVALRRDLDKLIASHEQAGRFLETPAVAAAVSLGSSSMSCEDDDPGRSPLPVGTRIDAYELDGLLGAGGMGEVYRARDLRLGRAVAIKILPPVFAADPERVRRVETEARATGSLNHPNVLAIYSLGIVDGGDADSIKGRQGSPFIVMELLEGESLRERLRRSRPATRKAVEWAVQIARGLAAAHAKGIVHRDLKPENIFVPRMGQLKILDFGLAKLAQLDARVGAHGTKAGLILGTPGYMAPEQLEGRAIDQRADIFSFGAILYEMLTGERAFPGATAGEALRALSNADSSLRFDAMRGLAPGVERIVRRCLHQTPDERFQSASDLAFALEAS